MRWSISKIKVGSRMSAPSRGKGTVIAGCGQAGLWTVKFDNGREETVNDWDIWDEAGQVHSQEW